MSPRVKSSGLSRRWREEYARDERGFQLREVAGGWRFYTHPAYHDIVEQYVLVVGHAPPVAGRARGARRRRVPPAGDPAGVNAVRGVNSEGVIASLIEKGLVREVGRDKTAGNAILYGTTRTFLRSFGLKDLEELPPLEEFAPDLRPNERFATGSRLPKAPFSAATSAKTTSPRWTSEGAPVNDPDDVRVVPMRLQKFLARAGVASRRGSEDLMTAGRVSVNGEVVSGLGSKVDPEVDVVTVDGREVRLADAPAYLALNKPTGFVTTMSDPQGRPTVASLVPLAEYPGLFPVGRLDQDTSGLLLFTTDGELSHRLLHPKWKVAKTYRARVDGRLTESEADRLRTGIELDDGPTQPAAVDVVSSGRMSEAVITIREGRKRQVRRMFSAVGHPVLELERRSFGPIELGTLAEGAVRELTPAELSALRAEVGIGESGCRS